MIALLIALSCFQVEVKVPENPTARQHVEVDVTPTQPTLSVDDCLARPTPLGPEVNYYTPRPKQVVQVPVVPVRMVPVYPVYPMYYYRAYPRYVRTGVLGLGILPKYSRVW